MSKIQHYSFGHKINLYNLCDIHRAHPLCHARFLQETIKRIDDDPIGCWVSTGDLGELAVTGSKGDIYTAYSPQWELDTLKTELSPIKDKCLGFTFSNHHKRTQQVSGLDFDMILAEYLGVPFLGKTGYLAITLGRGTYYVILHHGIGGGQLGNKINRARQLSIQRPGADLYLTGHTHSYVAFPLFQKYIDKKRLLLTKYKAWHQIGGHFINYDDSYADMMMLEEMPVCVGVTRLGFCKTGRHVVKKIKCEMITP